MTEHDPENLRVAYVRVTPGSDVCVIAVRCEAGPEGGTRAHVAYTLTALGERGSEYLSEDFSEERYRERMEAWEEAITRYLNRVVPTRYVTSGTFPS